MTINRASHQDTNMEEQKRLRLRDWLEVRIDDPSYPGLEWVNKEKKLFRIPWKHGARHGWKEEEDARLFREWSEHTGASPRDVKQRKANFRCALNSLRDVCQVHNMSKQKGDDAYRVYRMLPKVSNKQHKTWIKKRNPAPTSERSKKNRSSSSSRNAITPYPSKKQKTGNNDLLLESEINFPFSPHYNNKTLPLPYIVPRPPHHDDVVVTSPENQLYSTPGHFNITSVNHGCVTTSAMHRSLAVQEVQTSIPTFLPQTKNKVSCSLSSPTLNTGCNNDPSFLQYSSEETSNPENFSLPFTSLHNPNAFPLDIETATGSPPLYYKVSPVIDEATIDATLSPASYTNMQKPCYPSSSSFTGDWEENILNVDENTVFETYSNESSNDNSVWSVIGSNTGRHYSASTTCQADPNDDVIHGGHDAWLMNLKSDFSFSDILNSDDATYKHESTHHVTDGACLNTDNSSQRLPSAETLLSPWNPDKSNTQSNLLIPPLC